MAAQPQDSLTGLATKEVFDRILAELLNGEPPADSVSTGLLDVDQFLKLNETSGREQGDRVLGELGKLLRDSFADPARCFRLGGDEFAVVMPATEKEAAFLRLEQARVAFEHLESLSKISPHPTITIGLATFPDDGSTTQELLRKADDALFRAKTGGRNRIALAREEKKVPRTSHYTQGQLDRLSALSGRQGVGEAELLREALDDLLKKYAS